MIVLQKSKYVGTDTSLALNKSSKNQEQLHSKREGSIRQENVFERLSCQNTAAFKSLSERNKVGKKFQESTGKPRIDKFFSNSSDETASTLSSSLSSVNAPSVLSSRIRRLSKPCLSFDSHVNSPIRGESTSYYGGNDPTYSRFHNTRVHRHAGLRPSSLPRCPTHSKTFNKNDKEYDSVCVTPPRARNASPFHERLSSQQTKASAQRLQDKPPLHKQNHFAVDHVPFIPFVHSSTGSINGSEVSSITDARFPTPPPLSRRKRNVVPTMNAVRGRVKDGRDCHDNDRRKHFDRPARPEGKTLKKGMSTGVEKKKITRPFTSQDALYYRLSRAETVSSSRRKPSPLRKCALTPYEMELKKEQIMNNKVAVKKSSVYKRLSTQGTLSSIRKIKIESNQRYNSEYETFGESCKNALMRRFEGSTFVHH